MNNVLETFVCTLLLLIHEHQFSRLYCKNITIKSAMIQNIKTVSSLTIVHNKESYSTTN